MKQGSKEERIYDLLAKMSILFDNPPTQQRLIAYVKFLKRFPEPKVGAAIEKACMACFKFPTLAYLVQSVRGEKEFRDVAVQLSGKAISSISQFGTRRVEEAKEHLGPIAWQGIQAVGGWYMLSRVDNKSLPTVRAQLRDAIEAVLKSRVVDEKLAIDQIQLDSKNQLNGTQPSMIIFDEETEGEN